MIEIRDLSFAYNNQSLFNNLSLDISNKITGMIGINGAGKTTLLKLCVGLLHPKGGTIKINQFDVQNNIKHVLQEIGVLFENPIFPSWAKVFDYLTWVGRLRNLTFEESRQQSMLLIEKMGLQDKFNSPVSELSAGLRQRFGIAQAIIGVPRIIILDEPSANLDVKYRNEIFSLIKEISDIFQTKFLILSHILSDLEKYCDNIIILHEGKIRYNDKMSNILNSFGSKRYLLKSRIVNLAETITEELLSGAKIISSSSDEVEILLKPDIKIDEIKNAVNLHEITIVPKWSQLEEFFFSIIES